MPGKKTLSYMGLFFVVFMWGLAPFLTLELYKFYSPTIRVCFSNLVLVTAYLVMAGKNIRNFNFDYIKIGVPTGVFMTLANMSQKIGLLYTTPARYAFLENLSCITVPILMYILIKKKPKPATILASFICLLSAFILNGASFSGKSWGPGEILCAIAGLLYGFNIAGTGIYAKKLNVPLYLATQALTGFFLSLVSAVILNSVNIETVSGTMAPFEKIFFSFNPLHILFVILFTLITSALCWTIRTNSMKHIDASIVAIIMPFSAVFTGVLSVLFGSDILDMNLLVGGILGFLAIILSSFEDLVKKTEK